MPFQRNCGCTRRIRRVSNEFSGVSHLQYYRALQAAVEDYYQQHKEALCAEIRAEEKKAK